jgi:large subunit ribosomal protein L29
MLKMEEIQGLGSDELLEKVEKLKKDLMNYRFQAKTGKLERQSTIREVRRDIARLLTVLNQNPAEKKETAAVAKVTKSTKASEKTKTKKETKAKKDKKS